ncbi:MAG TPA: four helix bundle protein [Nevskiaceae bacterium]|nr:four helix bundle protein [Nevskiaceae bacterium]
MSDRPEGEVRITNEGMEKPRRDLTGRTFNFAKRVVLLCVALDKSPSASRTLAKQLLRSATSIGANVEEGQAGQSRADFISKLSIACKEARETHYWLRLLLATGLVSEQRATDLVDEANELVAILTTIVKNAKRRA